MFYICAIFAKKSIVKNENGKPQKVKVKFSKKKPGAFFLNYRLHVRKEEVKTQVADGIVARYIVSLPYSQKVAGKIFRWMNEQKQKSYSVVSVSIAFPDINVTSIVLALKRLDAIGVVESRLNRYSGQIDYVPKKSTFRLIHECRKLFPHLTDHEYILVVGYPYVEVMYRIIKIITAARVIEYRRLRDIVKSSNVTAKVNALVRANIAIAYIRNDSRVVEINITMLQRLYMIVMALDDQFKIEDEIKAIVFPNSGF